MRFCVLKLRSARFGWDSYSERNGMPTPERWNRGEVYRMSMIRKWLRRCRRIFRVVRAHSYKSEKVFCIGRNKTGVTSVDAALRELEYRVAPQRPEGGVLEPSRCV